MPAKSAGEPILVCDAINTIVVSKVVELRHLRYFVAVAEELSFRRAAERLHIAQPPLSAQIKALEAGLQLKLLERTTRSVSLTSAGRVFLEEARAILASVRQAEHRAKEAEQGVIGTLRVGIIAPMANAWVAAILRKFRHQLPQVQLSLFDLTSAEQLDQLRDGALDAGLLRPPVKFPELDCMVIGESRQVLALPKGHLLARKRGPSSWQDFHGQELVLMHPTTQHGFYDAFFAACARVGAKPVVAQYAHDIQTKLWLISAGFGIAPTTALVAELRRFDLVFRPLPPGLPVVRTVLAWRREDKSPLLQRLRDSFNNPTRTEHDRSGRPHALVPAAK
jgi:DNA-binding transcriptional LysR family regulator